METQQFRFEKASTIEEVLETSDMNWIAEQNGLITETGVSVPSHKALTRSDNKSVLGVVGKGYEPVQNSDAFAFMDTLVDMHKAQYEYLYSIAGGSKVLVQAKVDETFEVRQGDAVQTYITMINSFNGTTPYKVFFTPRRLFCDNQLRAAIREATESISIRHTKNIMINAEEALKLLCQASEYFDIFKQKARALAQKSVDKRLVDAFMNDVMGEAESTRKKRQIEAVTDLFENGKGNNGSSLWDLYNGVTEWVDHHGIKNPEKRLSSALVGAGSGKKAKAWNVAMELLDA